MTKNNVKIALIYGSLFVLCTVDGSLSVQVSTKILNLKRGDICGHSEESDEYYCKNVKNCASFADSIKNNKYLDVCCFIGKEPIVCCPPISGNNTPNTQRQKCDERIENLSIAVEECRKYTELDFPKAGFYRPYVTAGKISEPQEFPHMAILGYGVTTANKYDWKCGGSLISDRWILTAAHCYKIGSVARWARLGELDISSTSDIAQPKDYRLIKHVLHPDYEPLQRYNDIALFCLNTIVEFSAYIRPICLNTDPFLSPTQLIATGWGKIATGEPTSDILLKVKLDIFPSSQCNSTHFKKESKELKYGIIPESMICAGSFNDTADTCFGDSGGPLQSIFNHVETNLDMFMQFGITSFGTGFCGVKGSPAVYTRVSAYTSWIEKIVWPNN